MAILRLLALFFSFSFSLADPIFHIFGDSFVDTGNTKFSSHDLHINKGDHPPYGRDFSPPIATGRFCNGKILTDFIADHLNVEAPIEFFSPQAKGESLLKGINFAMAGSGYLEATGSTPLSEQVKNFENAQQNLSSFIGSNAVKKWTSDALFFVSTGGNDIVNYHINPLYQIQHSPEQFINLLISNAVENIMTLYNSGARKIIFLSHGPLGCPPFILTLLESEDGSCIKSLNDHAQLYNAALRSALQKISLQLEGSLISYGDIYNPLMDAIQNPLNYGFTVAKKACCGLGQYGGVAPCSTLDVCSNANEYVFWDSIHPTQAMYKIISDALFAENIKNHVNMLPFPSLTKELATSLINIG